jgi:hypothetical protein
VIIMAKKEELPKEYISGELFCYSICKNEMGCSYIEVVVKTATTNSYSLFNTLFDTPLGIVREEYFQEGINIIKRCAKRLDDILQSRKEEIKNWCGEELNII